MKIGIIGASGKAGQSIYGEATRRGHKTVAIVKNKAKAIEILGSNSDVLEADVKALRAKVESLETMYNKLFEVSPEELRELMQEISRRKFAEQKEEDKKPAAF